MKQVGLILGGTLAKGTIKLGQELMFGPDRNGNFKPIAVKGIHENRCDIKVAEENTAPSINVKIKGDYPEIKRNHIRAGSCLINPIKKVKGKNPYHNVCIKHFDADVRILHHHSTIQEGYQGVLHLNGIAQTV